MQVNKEKLMKTNWNSKKDMTVRELIAAIRKRPNIQFLLATGCIWFVGRLILIGMIAGNVIYLLYRIFNMVAMH